MCKSISIDWRRFPLDRPCVVLLGGLDLLRPLRLAGIATIVAGADLENPVFASRYCGGRCALPPLDQSEALADALVELGDVVVATTGWRPLLVYGNDGHLDFIYTHHARLSKSFLLLLNDVGIGRALLEKDRFGALAQDRRLPVPTSLAWKGTGPGTVAGNEGPVLVKPRQKSDWHDSPLHTRLFRDGGKALVFEDGRAAVAHPLVAHYHQDLVFQRFIPGDDSALWSYHGVADEEGTVLADFIGRKIRTFPPITGESTFIEMAQDDALQALGRDIAARIPLRGVFKMDFKKDSRDDRYYLLEINARFNLWHHLGAANGVNLIRAFYDYVAKTGAVAVPQAALTKRRWVYLRQDYRAYRALAVQGKLGFMGWMLSLLGSRKVYPFFAWGDPRPFISLWMVRLRRRARRSAGRALSWI
jgi:predicted ATP-grasp superfamily ATP-dependent carboligase